MLPTWQGGGASHQRGNAFPRAERGRPVFLARQGGCKGFFIRGRLLSIHRRPPQPSAAKPLSNFRTLGAIAPSNFRTLKPQRGLSIGRVNLREYSPAPPRSRSRSRPRHRRPTTTLAPRGETTHYDLCVALLLQIMFAVHAKGASNLSPLRTFGPAGRQPSSPTRGLSLYALQDG